MTLNPSASPGFRAPVCPAAGEALELANRGALDLWVCPASHGVAVTLSETYGQLQDDEIHLLWRLARAAAPGAAARSCPMCTRAMVAVDVGYDDDEIGEGEIGDDADAGEVLLDVCAECQVVWFDAGEMEQFPADVENAGPSDVELERVAGIAAAFGQAYDTALRERNTDITDRAYAMIARHPGALRALDGLGNAVLPDFKP